MLIKFPVYSHRIRRDSVMADHGDTDVKEERLRTLQGSGRHDLMRINNLSKVYNTRKLGRIRAVDKLTLAIPAGEVRTLSNGP